MTKLPVHIELDRASLRRPPDKVPGDSDRLLFPCFAAREKTHAGMYSPQDVGPGGAFILLGSVQESN